jgi:hypothetical protein
VVTVIAGHWSRNDLSLPDPHDLQDLQDLRVCGIWNDVIAGRHLAMTCHCPCDDLSLQPQ